MLGKSILGWHKMYYGMVRGGTRGGKGMDLGDLGRNNCGKTRGARGKELVTCK